MKREYSKPFVLKYTIIAFVGGLLFIVLALLIGAIMGGQPFGKKFIVEQHSTSPMLYMLDLLPIMLAIAAYFIARSTSIRRLSVEQHSRKEQQHQQRLYRFVEDLSAGKTDTEFESDGHNALDDALIGLRDYIANSKNDEAQRRQEDELRRWSTEGLAKFGEILRYNNDNIEELSYQVVFNLVKYVDANQGGFYLLDTSDKSNVHFRMTACYAYERRKYADRIIAWGDGLVGACAMERQMIHLKKVPDSFLKITSGLGQANPRNAILMPLKFNDEVHGVIELASFNPFEPHHIEFIEKVTESIATTISTVKNNIITSGLLVESRKQAEELAMKEEQMRQNMEELQAAQEELNRQSEKFISFSNSVNHTMVRAEIDVNGILIYANTKFLQKFEYSSNSEVEGKPITMFVNKKDRDWFDDIWLGLSRGGKHFEGDMKMQSRTGKELWMMATYTCVRNAEGGVENILFLGIDTTEKKQQSLYYEGQIHALDRSSLKLELYPTADIVAANGNFLNLMGYTDLRSQTLFDLISGTDRASIDKIWDDIIHGIQYEGQLRFISRNNEEKWLLCTFSAVNDMYDELSMVIMIANDVTREKLIEIENIQQNDVLKKQEEQLRQNEVVLNRKLKEAREEVKSQFKEIEKVKVRNEKTLDGFIDAIITIDHDGVVKFFNRAAEELFEVTRNDILEQNIKILFPDDAGADDEFLDAFLNPSKEKIVGQRREITITTRQGNELQVLMLLSEAKVGREATYTAFIQNITVDLF